MAPVKRAFLVVTMLLIIGFIYLGTRPLSHPRIPRNQYRAVESLRELNRAEQHYAARHPDVGVACNLSDLSDQGSEALSRAGLVDRVLASGTKAGYHYEIRCPQDGSQKATRYTVTAVPVKPGITGEFAFCSDQSGEIWYSEGGSISDCLAMRKPVEQKYR